MIRKDVDDFFSNWNGEQDLNISIVDHHMEKIKYDYLDNHGISKEVLRQKNMMEYCYSYKDNFLKSNLTKDEMLDKHLEYISQRKKAGVIALTKDKQMLLVRSCRKLCLPKGKQDYYDKDLIDTAKRELKEETGMILLYI